MNTEMIRKLNDEDMPAAMQLVDYTFHIEQGIPLWMNPLPAERSPIWWGLFLDGELKGTVASYMDNGTRHIGRLAIEPAFRGQHIGTKLLSTALEELFAQGLTEVYTDAREITVHILLRMGGEITGEPYEFYCGTCTPLCVKAEAFQRSKEGK